MKEVYVITGELLDDLVDYGIDIIGVASSVTEADKMIKEYFGEYQQLDFNDVRDSGIENTRTIKDSDGDKHRVTVMWYLIDKL